MLLHRTSKLNFKQSSQKGELFTPFKREMKVIVSYSV